MLILPTHENFIVPSYGSDGAAGLDLFMPEAGFIEPDEKGTFIKLGFKAIVPDNKVALLLPRSGVGCNHGLSLNNTIGVIDSDYRGEWIACLRIRDFKQHSWEAGDRLIQCLIMPVFKPQISILSEDQLTEFNGFAPSVREDNGFGSTGT